MASAVIVDNIINTSGTNLLINGYPRQPGQIIECLTGPCDGSVVTVGSGSYTLQNVSGVQTGTDAHADITGSTVAYTPPAGTTRVKYMFQYAYKWDGGTHCISHHKFFIDADEVVYARHSRSGVYPEGRFTFEWTIAIGGAANPNTGRVASWTTAKTLKMQFRRYAAGNPISVHGTTYWDGGGGVQLSVPVITIMAIA